MRWIVDGNNVFGSRPDGWWNDRAAAATRLTQRIAEWCRTHDDEVVVVFDRPVAPETALLAGGNLRVVAAPRRGRDAADDHIVELVEDRDRADASEEHPDEHVEDRDRADASEEHPDDRVADRDRADASEEHADDRVEDRDRADASEEPADDRVEARAADCVAECAAGVCVVTSDRGLRRRLPPDVDVVGTGRFRELIGY